ncbi:hypothetical protein IMCC3135_19110 [Granulosicoccus antarcticus IMCC3135]|uniref:Transposase IS66 central domain-containing protein n=1 Tax=Granulosicoccus antarcticus IMCC3135 TaxID=1192854 RepID=A0A2Z2NV51_9GAMM|nr:hypothetical protein IMCC3135_19110 [Granulosicoccus antarcticus IMCC3135]
MIQEVCYFLTHYSRGKVAADTLLGGFAGFLLTDDYAGYNRVPESRRQLCWPHLIRKFVDISERVGSAGRVGRRLLLISHAVIRTRHRWQNQCIDEATYFRRMRRLRNSFQKTLQRGSRLRIHGRTKRLGISSYQFLRTACTESMLNGRVETRFVFNPPLQLTHS